MNQIKRALTAPLNPAINARFYFLKTVGGFGLLAYHVNNCAKWGSEIRYAKMP